MAYSIRWYIPNSVLFAHHWGLVNYEEIRTSTRQLMDIQLAHVEYEIHVIINIVESKTSISPSEGIKLVQGIKRVPNLGWFVTIGRRGMIESFIMTLTTQLTQTRQTQVATLDEAVQFLTDRATLDWSQAKLDYPYLVYKE